MNKHIFWISSYPKSGNTLVRAILLGLFFSKDGRVRFEDMRNIGLFETTRRLNFIKSIGESFLEVISKKNSDENSLLSSEILTSSHLNSFSI